MLMPMNSGGSTRESASVSPANQARQAPSRTFSTSGSIFADSAARAADDAANVDPTRARAPSILFIRSSSMACNLRQVGPFGLQVLARSVGGGASTWTAMLPSMRSPTRRR
jgi:hypothetical protein